MNLEGLVPEGWQGIRRTRVFPKPSPSDTDIIADLQHRTKVNRYRVMIDEPSVTSWHYNPEVNNFVPAPPAPETCIGHAALCGNAVKI